MTEGQEGFSLNFLVTHMIMTIFWSLLRIHKIHKSDTGSHNQLDGMSHNNSTRTTTLLTFMLIHQLRNNILVTCITVVYVYV